MKISEWLDKKEKDGVDVSEIELPHDLSHDEDPDESIYFKEIRTVLDPLPGKSSSFHGQAFRALVLCQRSGQESRRPQNRNELAVFYER